MIDDDHGWSRGKKRDQINPHTKKMQLQNGKINIL